MSKMRNNPRIIVTVSDNGVNCKGVYIDSKDNVNSFNRQFNFEYQAFEMLDTMRYENDCEFSVQVNRINWKG